MIDGPEGNPAWKKKFKNKKSAFEKTLFEILAIVPDPIEVWKKPDC
jgi:hypothetical protein